MPSGCTRERRLTRGWLTVDAGYSDNKSQTRPVQGFALKWVTKPLKGLDERTFITPALDRISPHLLVGFLCYSLTRLSMTFACLCLQYWMSRQAYMH
jgi:hypothetical protein